MQLASMNRPRSVKSSETCRYASGYRKYQRTASRITSPGYWRPLNGFVGVIGTGSYPTRATLNFATEPGRALPFMQSADWKQSQVLAVQ